MADRIIIHKNEYYDSIQLMRISEELRKLRLAEQVMVTMATESNKQILKSLGLTNRELEEAGNDDLAIAIRAESEEIIAKLVGNFETLLKKGDSNKKSSHIHSSISDAIKKMPEANLCVITLPGELAVEQAEIALEKGLHVIIYSDNIPLDQDRAIKQKAVEKGLLCMGPDCGVANLNGVAFLTASVVKKGPIGIVGASGSGTQLIAALTEREGLGISQAIGVGGKDLKDEVGGISMLMAIDALESDPETEVLILVSRVPGENTLSRILDKVRDCRKPVVVYFIGCEDQPILNAGAIPAKDLEDAALKAVKIFKKEDTSYVEFTLSEKEVEDIVSSETEKMAPAQKYIRGLFAGGTFCDEAITQLKGIIGEIHSNTIQEGPYKLKDSFTSIEHTIIDLGDEEFTLGRPHPVIDPEPLRMGLKRESQQPEVAVILLDFILGPAINPDPVGSVITEIVNARKTFEKKGGYLCVVASVCGTEGDPQRLSSQTRMLRDAGVIVMPSNAQAARICGHIIKSLEKRN